MYYLFVGSLLCYFIGEYGLSPLKPAPLVPQSLSTILMRIGFMAAVHLAVLGVAFGFWGLALGAALLLFHTLVDLLTRPIMNAVTGKRVLLTLADLVLHIISMYALTAMVSALYIDTIAYTTALLLRYGAAAATGIFFYPALAKTLLVDGFPRFYSERPLFELTEWLTDAGYGLIAALLCLMLPWWLALILIAALSAGFFILGNRAQPGRPVLVLTKIGVLLILVPCFLFVFKV